MVDLYRSYVWGSTGCKMISGLKCSKLVTTDLWSSFLRFHSKSNLTVPCTGSHMSLMPNIYNTHLPKCFFFLHFFTLFSFFKLHLLLCCKYHSSLLWIKQSCRSYLKEGIHMLLGSIRFQDRICVLPHHVIDCSDYVCHFLRNGTEAQA